MKVELKENIWIEGSHSPKYIYGLEVWLNNHGSEIIYKGKTSEISEELAKEYVELLAKTSYGNFYRNYQYNKPQPVSFTKCTAKESIQSACQSEFCIIYKTK